MALRKINPTTPGQRFKQISAFDDITCTTPEKSLLVPMKKSGGRNNQGKMTVRNIGGGHKRQYRLIDFKRDRDGVKARVKTIEYDPNRSARIALVVYEDGEKRYIVAPNGLQIGQIIESGKGAAPEVGNALFLSDIPLGTVVHNIEMRPGQGQYCKKCRIFAQLVSREGKYAILKMPSGETRENFGTCKATVGSVSNSDHALENSGKAGRSRWLGRRQELESCNEQLITQWVVVKEELQEVNLALAQDY